MAKKRRRISSEERKKKLTGRRRSLSRRKKELPEELKRVSRTRKTKAPSRRKRSRKPRTTVYQKLSDLVRKKKGPETLVLTFMEIEEALERRLPTSARKYKAWWANNRSSKATSRHSRAWMDHGYLVSDIDFKKGAVTLSRAHGKKKEMPYAAMLIEAARSLSSAKKTSFSRKELFTEVSRLHPRALIHDHALNPVIQAMIEKSNSGKMVAERWRETFHRLERGLYKLNTRGAAVDLKRPRAVKIKGKTVKTRLRYYLLATRQWDLEPGAIKLGRGLPSLDYDLVTPDGSVAVCILKARSLKNRDLSRAHLFEALYSLERAPSKAKLLVIEEKSSRAREQPSDHLLKEYGKLMKQVEVCKYILGSKPEKDKLVPVK